MVAFHIFSLLTYIANLPAQDLVCQVSFSKAFWSGGRGAFGFGKYCSRDWLLWYFSLPLLQSEFMSPFKTHTWNPNAQRRVRR